MAKKRCGKCVHFRYDKWLSMNNDMGVCSKRNSTVYFTGLPCRHYEEVSWWKKVWAKRFFRGE